MASTALLPTPAPFARLYPANSPAKKLFSRAIEFMELADDGHHISFLDESLNDMSLSEVARDTDDDLTDTSYGCFEPIFPEPESRSGSLILSFHLQSTPSVPRIGWRAGRGTSKHAHYGVDFLLASPYHSRRDKLPTIGFYFRFHAKSGMLILVAGPKAIEYKIDGTWVKIPEKSQHVLMYESNEIRIAGCEYQLVFCILEHERLDFYNNRNLWISEHTKNPAPTIEEWQIPSKRPLRRTGGVMICGSLAYGGFGWVYTGVDCMTGNPLAIKEESVKSETERNRIMEEVKIGMQFDELDGLMATIGSWCEHEESGTCTRLPEKVYLSSSLALYDFSSLNWKDLEHKVCLGLCRKVLVGMCELHRRGIMHRDISKKNMLVLSLDPPDAALCDYGKSIQQPTSTYKSIGPLRTVAPEVHDNTGPYSMKIDVWSWAYAVSELLCYRYDGGDRIFPRRYDEILKSLRSHADTFPYSKKLVGLLQRMLAWDPKNRPSSQEALKHDCWHDLRPVESLQIIAPRSAALISITDPVIRAPRNDRKRKASDSTLIVPRTQAQHLKPEPENTTQSDESARDGASVGGDILSESIDSNRSPSSRDIEAKKRKDLEAVNTKVGRFMKAPGGDANRHGDSDDYRDQAGRQLLARH